MRSAEIKPRVWGGDPDISVLVYEPVKGVMTIGLVDRFKTKCGDAFLFGEAEVDDFCAVIGGAAVVMNEPTATISIVPRGDNVIIRFIEDGYPSAVEWFIPLHEYTKAVSALV